MFGRTLTEAAAEEEEVTPYQLWVAFVLLAILAVIGFVFEASLHKLHEKVTGHHHGLVRYDDNLWLLVFKSMQSEITVLGFIAFVAYALEMMGLYAYITHHNLAQEEAFRAEVEMIHMTLFVTMLIHVMTLGLMTYHAEKVVKELDMFKRDEHYEHLIASSSVRFPKFQAMCNSIEDYMRHTKTHFPTVKTADYLQLKIKYDLRRMIEFNEFTWLCVVVLSGSIALGGFFSEGAESDGIYQWSLTFVFGAVIVASFLFGYSFYKEYAAGPPMEWHKGEKHISNFRKENVVIRCMQVFQFFINLKWVFLIYGTGMGHWAIETTFFVLYLIVVPRLMVRYGFLVLSTPPYFDLKDLVIIKEVSGEKLQDHERRFSVMTYSDQEQGASFMVTSIRSHAPELTSSRSGRSHVGVGYKIVDDGV